MLSILSSSGDMKKMQLKLLVEGGNMQPGPALSQKIGPLGLNLGQILQKVNAATSEFKGLKVPVTLEINAATKDFEVVVSSPPVSELLKKELGITKGSGAQKKLNVANASIEQIISVAKAKMQNMLSRDLRAAVKTVLGSCVSLGILVENKPAVEVEKEVEEGKYDKEINSGNTETPEEKKKSLNEFFSGVQEKQEKEAKAAAAAEAAAAEEKAKEAEGAAKPAAGTEEKAAEPSPRAPAASKKK